MAASDEWRGIVWGTGVRWRMDGVQTSGAQVSYDGLAGLVGGKAVAVLPYCLLGRLRCATPAAGARKRALHPLMAAPSRHVANITKVKRIIHTCKRVMTFVKS